MRRTRTCSILTVLVVSLAAGLTPVSSGATTGTWFVDWGAKQLDVGTTGRFEIDFWPGDGPFLRVWDRGQLAGGLELIDFPDLGPDHPIVTDGWDAWVEALYDSVEEDRRVGCDPGYRIDRRPVEPASFGPSEGVRYGFTGTWPDGRVSERSVFHAVVHDDQLFILAATALADDSCIPREGALELEVYPDLEPIIARVAAASVLPDRGVPSARRFAGPDRYATAAASALGSFGSGAPEAVLASGASYPDALAATYLAGQRTLPVLLTDPNRLPAATKAALESLGVTEVTVIGGPAAVSETVLDEIRSAGWVVERIGGADRYSTAALVATRPTGPIMGSTDGDGGPTTRSAFIATGEAFPDAVAAGQLAFAAGIPLLLTPSTQLAAVTRDALVELRVDRVFIAGGPRAVTPEVEEAVAAMGIETVRVAGADRTETAAAFAELAVSAFGFQTHHVVLARGDTFADALVGGVHGGSRIAPLLLTASPTTLGAAGDWLERHARDVSVLHVLGGAAAVTDQTVAAARAAATDRSVR